MIADMSDPSGLWAIEVAGASGHPGSPHYDDQIRPWLAGEYNFLPLTETPPDATTTLTLHPRGA
jgi:penicillin amidase